MKNEALFRTGSVWKSIISMAVPSIIIILVMVLYNMADMFLWLSGRYRTGGGGLRCGAGVFDPFGSGDHAWRRQQRHHCTLLWRRRDRAGQDLLLALLLEQLFLGVLVSIGLLVSRVPLLGVLGSNAEFFPMQSGIFRSLHWVRRFLSCPTAWRCWCVQRAQ